MDRACTVISGDLYNIAERVKSINLAYFIVFNKRLCRFEVHAEGQRGGTYALTLPFTRLDARALRYVQKTRAANLAELIAEAERDNERLLKQEAAKKAEKILEGI